MGSVYGYENALNNVYLAQGNELLPAGSWTANTKNKFSANGEIITSFLGKDFLSRIVFLIKRVCSNVYRRSI